MKLLDRYVIRETIGPFFMALGLYTFLLAITPMLRSASELLSKGVPMPTVGFLLVLLLPASLAATIPMSFLTGVLMALGRLSGDRESVALLACGVSPLRLLRPVLLMATVVVGADLYVMLEAVPDWNQRYIEILYGILAQKTEADIKPRIFYEGFPGKAVFYYDGRPDGTWGNVMLADTSQPGRPSVVLADEGRLLLDKVHQRVEVHLRNAVGYVPGTDEGIYDTERSDERSFSVGPEEFFDVSRKNITQMTIAELNHQIAEKAAMKPPLSPHNEIMAIQLKFSFPAAAFVFAFLGLALGMHTRKEGKLAGLTLGIGVIFLYYGLLQSAEAMAKGHQISAVWARWIPNIVLGVLGVVAVWWRMRATGSTLSVPIPAWLMRRIRRIPKTEGSSGAVRVVTAPRPVVVIRIPRLNVPRPRLLDLYVSKRYLQILALAFFGLMVLYYVGTLIDLSEKVFKGQASAAVMAQFLWFSTPQFIYYVVPLAALVAVLATVGGLTRSSELTVMRACGVSLYRVAAPLLLLAFVWSAALFILEDRILGPANKRAQTLADTIRNRGPAAAPASRNWLASRDGRLFYYTGFANHRELSGVTVFETAQHPFRLVRQTFATRAIYQGDTWRAERGWVQQFPAIDRSTRESFEVRNMRLEAPENFGAADAEPDVMTFRELYAYTRSLDASGFNIAEQRVDLYGRLSYPLVTFVMTLIGIPFALTTGRRGALYGIGLALVLAVSYWLITAIFVASGKAMLMPAMLAAAAPTILFTAFAGYLVLTVRT